MGFILEFLPLSNGYRQGHDSFQLVQDKYTAPYQLQVVLVFPLANDAI